MFWISWLINSKIYRFLLISYNCLDLLFCLLIFYLLSSLIWLPIIYCVKHWVHVDLITKYYYEPLIWESNSRDNLGRSKTKVVNLPSGEQTIILYVCERLCFFCQCFTHEQTQCPIKPSASQSVVDLNYPNQKSTSIHEPVLKRRWSSLCCVVGRSSWNKSCHG